MRFGTKLLTVAGGLICLCVTNIQAAQVCSNSTLKGRYAHLIQGVYGPLGNTAPFTETNGDALPFQGIQMLEFDGKGTLKGTESLVVSGAEITNNGGKHFVPVVGSFSINPDCTGIGYICSNHDTGTISGGPETCTGKTIGTPGFLWEDFVQVTIVLAEQGGKFHMLVVPPFDGGNVVRTISSTGTRLDDVLTESRDR